MADETEFPVIAELKDVPVSDATAIRLAAWVYPLADESDPPALMIESLKRDHVKGTVSLVLRPKGPPAQD